MNLFIAILTITCITHAQELNYLTDPVPRWNPVNVPPLGKGNGVFVSPDQSVLLVTSADGSITSLNAKNGTINYTSRPTALDNYPSFSTSGVSFGTSKNNGDFAVYAVSYGFVGIDPSFWYVRSGWRFAHLSLAGVPFTISSHSFLSMPYI